MNNLSINILSNNLLRHYNTLKINSICEYVTINLLLLMSVDIYYSEKYIFFIDLKIILLTIFIVLMRKGISPKDSAIMKEFSKNN